MGDEQPVELGIAGLEPAVRIGSGGFADVYRARQTNLRRDVAVKVLRGTAADQNSRMRFERECHAVGAVSGHPHIVGVHEGGFTADGRAYLVMEYFSGGSLRERLEEHRTLPAAEVSEIGRKIGGALAVAHDAGVLHRDVKPANILISAYGEPALADFGIARVDGGQQTATGMVTASFAHAAPEVLEGGAPSAASDVYSLGSTLFELATGRSPHFRSADDSVWALMHRVVTEPAPDPASLGVPDPLATVIRRATARQPASRFADARELVDALSPPTHQLAHQISQQPAPAEPVSRPTVKNPSVPPPPDQVAGGVTQGLPQQPHSHEYTQPYAPVPSRPRRWPRLVAALVILVVAFGAGLYVFLSQSDDPLPDLVLAFTDGASGPIDEGVPYALTVDGALADSTYQVLVDGELQGEATDEPIELTFSAGRHVVEVDVTRGSSVDRTDPVDIYVIGLLPEAGFRVNLASTTATPSNWQATLDLYDTLVDEGHEDLEILPSDRFASLTPGRWNLFVPGFGEDRAAAVEYCNSFDLEIPRECVPGRFDPDQ